MKMVRYEVFDAGDELLASQVLPAADIDISWPTFVEYALDRQGCRVLVGEPYETNHVSTAPTDWKVHAEALAGVLRDSLGESRSNEVERRAVSVLDAYDTAGMEASMSEAQVQVKQSEGSDPSDPGQG